MTNEAWRQRDAQLLEMLKDEPQVAARAIIREYAPYVQARIKKFCPTAQLEDVEEVTDDVFEELWKNHDREHPIWPFLNYTARWRGLDLARKLGSSDRRVAVTRRKIAEAATGSIAAPLDQLIEHEGRLMALELFQVKLTPRQQIAVRARCSGVRNWDKALATQHGGTAKSWRKCAVEGLARLRAS